MRCWLINRNLARGKLYLKMTPIVLLNTMELPPRNLMVNLAISMKCLKFYWPLIIFVMPTSVEIINIMFQVKFLWQQSSAINWQVCLTYLNCSQVCKLILGHSIFASLACLVFHKKSVQKDFTIQIPLLWTLWIPFDLMQ